MSDALLTAGVLIQRGNGDGPPETFTTIAEIVSFTGPDGEATEIPATHLLSVAKETKIGLMDEGNFNFEAHLIPSDVAQTGLRNDRKNRTLRNFKLTLTDTPATVLTFSAYVKRFAITGEEDGLIRVSVGLRISGGVVWS